MSDEQNPLDQAFFTDNAQLATALRTAGCQHPVNEKGEITPCRNIYTREILEKLGYKGWDIEAAAADASRKGLHGLIVYCFVRTDALFQLHAGWEEQAKMNFEAAKRMKNREREIGGGEINVELFDMGRLFCIAAANRKPLMEAWKHVRPTIEIQGESKSEALGEGHTLIRGSFKQFSLNPSAETRRKLEL